ncbi:MAG: hypothetical protein JEZ06_04325 [Anaerolineaceae bacterium]|nr:hypothetical protein [Anaerolineaceae bacterium]
MYRLNDALNRKITLVSAPAGFGKTSLLASWSNSHENNIVWISLEKSDNDPEQFSFLLASAFESFQSTVFSPLLSLFLSNRLGNRTNHNRDFLTGLINEIISLNQEIILVFEDFHNIQDPEIHQELQTLFRNCPSNLHMVFSTRITPSWPLSRLRAEGQINEITSDDLRFSNEETNQYLSKVLGIDFPPQEINKFQQATEGWPIGIQMAALSIKKQINKSVEIIKLDNFNRHLLDYLLEEILQQQSPEIQEFIFKMVYLGRFNPSLSDQITSKKNSHTLIQQLTQANLFIEALDQHAYWYRFQPLFASLIRDLRQKPGEFSSQIFNKASIWFDSHGEIELAIQYSIKGLDYQKSIHMIVNHFGELLEKGIHSNLLHWINLILANLTEESQTLLIHAAWIYVLTGEKDKAQTLLKRIQNLFISKETNPTSTFQNSLLVLQSYDAFHRGSWQEAQNLAERGLQAIGNDSPWFKKYAAIVLAISKGQTGDFASAARSLKQAATLFELSGQIANAIEFHCEFARAQGARGLLHNAFAICQKAQNIASAYQDQKGHILPVSGYISIVLSSIYAEWNQPTKALQFAEEGFQLCMKWGLTELMVDSLIMLSTTHAMIGNRHSALKTIGQAKIHAEQLSPRNLENVKAFEARIFLLLGELPKAIKWASAFSYSKTQKLKFEDRIKTLTLAKTLILQERYAEAIRILRPLKRAAHDFGADNYVIQAAVLEAAALNGQKETSSAFRILQEIIQKVEEEDYQFTFLQIGEKIKPVLAQFKPDDFGYLYCQNLSNSILNHNLMKEKYSPKIEPLTNREIQIISILESSFNSVELAAELNISPNTIRSHIKSIYNKLNVHSRQDAVRKAKEMKIIPGD